MGSFIITKRLAIGPGMFDATQISYVLVLLVVFGASGYFANRASWGSKYHFRICLGLATFATTAVCLYIGYKFRVPGGDFLPDLVFAMLSFSLGYHLPASLEFIGVFDKEPELSPVQVRVTRRLDALMARQYEGSERPIFTEALMHLPFSH